MFEHLKGSVAQIKHVEGLVSTQAIVVGSYQVLQTPNFGLSGFSFYANKASLVVHIIMESR